MNHFLTDYPPHWGGKEPAEISIGYNVKLGTRHETFGLVTARKRIAEVRCMLCKRSDEFAVYIYEGDDLNSRAAEALSWHLLYRHRKKKGGKKT